MGSPPKDSTSNDIYEALLAQPTTAEGTERDALKAINPGFHLRPPPSPHQLASYITPESALFQTIHMGAAVVDAAKYRLVIDGLVATRLTCSLQQLRQLPRHSVTSFHECYGSPLKPPTTPVWRVGNVKWTGVRLKTLLELVEPLPEARYVWSDGLDYGSFAGKSMDRYQKDLPMAKAVCPEVLLAYEMNGEALGLERGGPVRLVVPGWFGTNSTKWVCRLSLQLERSASPFTTTWYNEVDPTDPDAKRMRPVWMVEPNSVIVCPAPDQEVKGEQEVVVNGWAWSNEGIDEVQVSADGGVSWQDAYVQGREEFEWQSYSASLHLSRGRHLLMARATSMSGISQPLDGRRNHVHSVAINVV